jgi:hypothetical protein
MGDKTILWILLGLLVILVWTGGVNVFGVQIGGGQVCRFDENCASGQKCKRAKPASVLDRDPDEGQCM